MTIDLESSDADTYLYLRSGSARSGTALYENDDVESGNRNSRIEATLSAGSYTIEATTYNPDTAGSFTLRVSGLGGTETTPGTGSDRDALVALYNATDGPNWKRNTYWLTDAFIGDWDGVTAFNSGRVRNLDLPTNQLKGEIPPELGNLSNLERLYLGGNELSGEIPPELGNLSNLEHLYLDRNGLSGEIPPELGNLANLERLFLPVNELSGEIPPELGNLANLERLDLWNNQLSGEIPPELGNLANLISLRLWDNQLSGEIPPELGNLANLERLNLDGNSSLSGPLPSSFTGLTSLEFLSLEGTGLCAPTDAAFQAWLQGVHNKSGVVNCA